MANNREYVRNLKRHQFMPGDLSAEAFELYSNGDEVFYTDEDGNYYEADNSLASFAYLVGEDLGEVEEYFQWALEEFEDVE